MGRVSLCYSIDNLPGRKKQKTRAKNPNWTRANDWMPRHKDAWSEPIPTLLRGDEFSPYDKTNRLEPQRHLPHLHQGGPFLPEGVPYQNFPRVNLTMLRGERDVRGRTLGGVMDSVPVPPELRVAEG